MSKTYKHQIKYYCKAYNWSFYPWARAPREALENKFIPQWGMNVNVGPRKRHWERYLRKSFRQTIKRKLQKGDYDSLPKRPERSAWYVW